MGSNLPWTWVFQMLFLKVIRDWWLIIFKNQVRITRSLDHLPGT
ncbi:hypothetical protein Gotur_000636 [Gossypium turneri]